MMKWNLAGLAGLAVLVELQGAPADACGVKLTITTSSPRKAVAHSSNPSHMLLIGTPPRRLERDLSAAGHDVEVAKTVSSAKRKQYAVVSVGSNEQAEEARSSFSGAVVVVRSGDVASDTRSIEDRIARAPVRVDESRAVVAARSGRAPIAAGPRPDPRNKAIAAKEPDAPAEPAVKPAPEPAVAEVKVTPPPAPKVVTPPPPEKVTTAVPKEETVAPAEPMPKPKAVVHASKPSEVYFTLGASKLGGTTALAKTAHWLTDSPDVNVVVEGYADPSGTPENNMALSQARAEWVRDFLVSAGIDSSRMEVVSYGDTRLKYGRTDPRNRRVAIEPKK